MLTKKNKNYTAEFKAKVALDAIKGDLTISEISRKYGGSDGCSAKDAAKKLRELANITVSVDKSKGNKITTYKK